jgi:uncharacterized protein YabN with tetrapyrrole methylase and pyrophosphatase domain
MTYVEDICISQAKRVFNNNLTKLIIKLREEVKELDDELFTERIDRDKVVGELGDVMYILNQIAEKFDTSPQKCLRIAYNKIQEREEQGLIEK